MRRLAIACLKKVRRVLRQLWCVLKWDDAVVYRQRSVEIFIRQFHPGVYGTSASNMSCRFCFAEWGLDGNPVGGGHASWCHATIIEKELAKVNAYLAQNDFPRLPAALRIGWR